MQLFFLTLPFSETTVTMNQCATILVVLLATGILVNCQDETVSTTASPTTEEPVTSETSTSTGPTSVSDEMNDQPVFIRPMDQLLNQQQNQQQFIQPLGQESIASDLISTLSGFLPSFPSLPGLGNPSLPCLGLSSMASGRCLSPSACLSSGGSEEKGCLTGGHVCCIPASKCGSVIRGVDTWVSNDDYPNTTTVSQSCLYTINKASPVIGQLRIQLDSLQLAKSADCEQDKLLIDGVSGVSVFPVCGLASGSHLIIPFSSSSLTLRVVTSNTVDKVQRKWRMRVTQFANNGPNVAPAGCTQLYSADGILRSLGEGMGSSGQKYAVCFQKRQGMCGIRFDMSSFQRKVSENPQSITLHQQRMDQFPLEPQPMHPQPVEPREGRPISKRQIVSVADLNLQTPFLGFDERLQISKPALPVVEKVAPPPKPQPHYTQPYGNSIYHQPAQHGQQMKPQVQPWQHAHKPVYGGSYGQQYAPAPQPPVPQPAVVKEVFLPKPVEVVQTAQPQVVQKTLVAEANLLGLVGLNNSATLQVPKGIAETVFNPLGVPGLALLETPKTIIATNGIPDGTIQGIQLGSNPGVVVTRNRRGDEESGDGSVGCLSSLFIPPTGSSGGQLLCLESGKYTGPGEVSMMGDPLVAFVESSAGAVSGWEIPFSFLRC